MTYAGSSNVEIGAVIYKEAGMADDRNIFRFGVYEADASTGELRKGGVRIRLQEQPFQVLVMLLSRSGEVVSRDEICRRLWPADTFVDFDHGLNTVINKLRETLGDSSANPRFIETLARRGYRFIAPVHVNGKEMAAEAAADAGGPPTARERTAPQEPLESPESSSSLLAGPEDYPAVPRNVVRLLFSLIQAMYLITYLVALARLGAIESWLAQVVSHPHWFFAAVIVIAVVGIPVRLYLLTAAAFDYRHLPVKFRKLFPYSYALDEIWALAAFLTVPDIGWGLAFAAVAILLYLPFSQRSLMLMGYREAASADQPR